MAARDKFESIKVIGIPRALLYYRYGDMWQRFFEELGFDVVVSGDTDREVFEVGEAASVDECCLASKVYMGHVASLLGKCDAVFVPCYDSADHRAGFCTKYQSLPDLVAATFHDKDLNIVSLHVEKAADRKKTGAAFIDLACRMGAKPHKAAKAWKAARRAQEHADARRAADQAESIRLLSQFRKVVKQDPTGTEKAPLAILLVAHPYISHDRYIAGDVVAAIERMGAVVIYADEVDHATAFKRSFDFSPTLPWVINRELAGAIMNLHNHIDGIVLLSAFPCGPDSMFDDAVLRGERSVPVLNLTIDSQSGSAGMETRVESFIDILQFKGRGAYLNG